MQTCRLPFEKKFQEQNLCKNETQYFHLTGLIDRKVNKFGRKSFTESSLLPWKLVDLLMMPTANQLAVFSRVIYKQFYSTEPKEFFIIFLLYLGSLPRPTEALIPQSTKFIINHTVSQRMLRNIVIPPKLRSETTNTFVQTMTKVLNYASTYGFS